MIEGLKPFYGRALGPAALLVSRLGIHPNLLTLSGVVLFGVAGWYSYRGSWGLSVIFTVAGALMDGLDGLVARRCGKKSVFGAVLDSVCDRITEILWVGGILFYYLANTSMYGFTGVYLCFAALTLSITVSYIKARAEGAGIECPGGILQRPERIIIIAAFMLAGPQAMLWGMGLISLLALVTIIQRFMSVYRNSAAGPARTSEKPKS